MANPMNFPARRALAALLLGGIPLALVAVGSGRVRAGQPPVETPPAAPSERPIQPTAETSLFNGKDLTGFYTFLPSKGVNKDPDGIFKVEDGMIHILGKEFGYIATEKPYANYVLTFEQKWGEKRWPPRENAVRDSGCLVHFVGRDTVWPQSFECQIQENDFGDIFHLGGISSVVNGKRENGRVVRSKSWEKPRGEWNTLELIVKNDSVTNIVNGHVVNVATQMTRGKDGTGGPLNSGKILFQSEGAEVYYRNIRIKPLPAVGAATRLPDRGDGRTHFQIGESF